MMFCVGFLRIAVVLLELEAGIRGTLGELTF